MHELALLRVLCWKVSADVMIMLNCLRFCIYQSLDLYSHQFWSFSSMNELSVECCQCDYDLLL